MATTWKTIRVFISSTFRDMHAERDQLVKVVFPALRERLEKVRVHLIDIDLRWGVTREQADNDQALDVCLDQIDACRPFFDCSLRDRLWLLPDSLPAEEQFRFRGQTDYSEWDAAAEDPRVEGRALRKMFIENRIQVHVPRAEIERRLTAYAGGDGSYPLVLPGPPGSGKSVTIAYWEKSVEWAESTSRSNAASACGKKEELADPACPADTRLWNNVLTQRIIGAAQGLCNGRSD